MKVYEWKQITEKKMTAIKHNWLSAESEVPNL